VADPWSKTIAGDDFLEFVRRLVIIHVIDRPIKWNVKLSSFVLKSFRLKYLKNLLMSIEIKFDTFC